MSKTQYIAKMDDGDMIVTDSLGEYFFYKKARISGKLIIGFILLLIVGYLILLLFIWICSLFA